MSQELLGNVFWPGRPGVVCKLEVAATKVIATEFRPADGQSPAVLEFPLSAEAISFSGDDQSQVLLVHPDGAKLYCDRNKLVPGLHQNSSAEVRTKLQGETRRATTQRRKASAALLGFVASIALVCVLAVQVLNWTVDRAVDRIPLGWETQLGSAAMAGLGEPEIIDPKVVEPVKAVLDRVLAAAGEQPYTFEIHVIRNPAINAMALPGGHIVVYTGLLEKTSRPEELAGVLGHEIQHVLGRHGLRNVVHSLKWQILASLVTGDVSAVQSVVLAHGSQFLSLSHGRALEEEADREGAILLLKSDIDPQGLSDFFRLMQKEEGVVAQIPVFMRSHPQTASRIEAVESFIATRPDADGSYTKFDLDWDGMKKSLAEEQP